jgi:DNA-binding transcriptional LysR family regulator
METLSNLESFVRSAEAGNFSAAARGLGLTPAAVSKNVARLEANLGVLLFQRSTRRITLTEAGERFLQDVGCGLQAIQGAIANVTSASGHPAGTLKVNLPPSFGMDYVLPLFQQFVARYPAVVPDLQFENRQVDLIAEGFDAAIGGLELSPGVVARELSRIHVVALASPGYMRGRPTPRTPADLATLDGVAMRSTHTGRIRQWNMRNAAGKEMLAEPRTRIALNEPDALCRAAAMDLGVTLVAMPNALPYLERGTLMRLLPQWHADVGAISLYFSGQKLLPAKTRAFVDFVVENFRQQKLAQRFAAR